MEVLKLFLEKYNTKKAFGHFENSSLLHKRNIPQFSEVLQFAAMLRKICKSIPNNAFQTMHHLALIQESWFKAFRANTIIIFFLNMYSHESTSLIRRSPPRYLLLAVWYIRVVSHYHWRCKFQYCRKYLEISCGTWLVMLLLFWLTLNIISQCQGEYSRQDWFNIWKSLPT